MLPFAPLRAWMDRVAAGGHGERQAMSTTDALAVAHAAEPEPVRGVAAGDPSGLTAGTRVVIRCDDANDPIAGTLVGADATSITIRHEDARAGTVHVHLPRFGYSVVAEAA